MRRMLGADPIVVTGQAILAPGTPTGPAKIIQAQNAAVLVAQAEQAKYDSSIAAYQQSLAKLQPSWSPLPVAPYPPSGDNSNFPRSGSQSLFLNQAQVSAAQLAEPQKVVYYQKLDADARRPKLNWYFVVGAACLVGYFVVRRQ